VFVSGTVYDYVKNKVKSGFNDLGTQTLKNIAERVRVYRVADLLRGATVASNAKFEKPLIAVLTYAGLAVCYEWAAWHSAWAPTEHDLRTAALQYARKAVAIDDTDHEPRFLAWVHHQRREFDEATSASTVRPHDGRRRTTDPAWPPAPALSPSRSRSRQSFA
jgi:hypothetical protein